MSRSAGSDPLDHGPGRHSAAGAHRDERARAVGPLELVIVLVIALLILGPKQLPEVDKSIGNGMREFKDAISGSSKNDDDDEDEVRPLKTSERA